MRFVIYGVSEEDGEKTPILVSAEGRIKTTGGLEDYEVEEGEDWEEGD